MRPSSAFTIIAAAFLLSSGSPDACGAGLIGKAGAKLAITSAGQSFDYAALSDLDSDRRLGFGVGGFIEWFDLPVFSLITQLEYMPRGMKQDFNVTTAESPDVVGTISIDNRLDYLSLPVLAKARIELASVTPYVIAGVRFDHLLGYESDQGAFNLVYDAFDRTSIGGSVGAGVDLGQVLPAGLFAEFRYNFDFDDAYSTELLTVSNNAVDLWIGVTF